jgi:MmyB-like transcription regulator ligand binding domain
VSVPYYTRLERGAVVGVSDSVLDALEEFRRYWARHHVRFHFSGVKRLHHRQVGAMELRYEGLEVVFETDLTIYAYTAGGLQPCLRTSGGFRSPAASSQALGTVLARPGGRVGPDLSRITPQSLGRRHECRGAAP